ncbi:MAG: hypothetical protein WD423_07860 [Rhodothermales bacterium]
MHDIIASCAAMCPRREHVTRLVELCFRMARVYLRRRAVAGRLNPDFFGLTLDDLALDCIAELFERDEDGRFPHLVTYYEPILAKHPSRARLLGATRRLVFSKVSEGLYRRYREADPSLAKLIRNLRYAIRTGDVGVEDRIRGHLWVTFGRHDPDVYSRPVMSEEYLQVRLSACVDASTSLKDVVKAVRQVVLENGVYAPGYPMVGLASVMRRIYDLMSDDPLPKETSLDSLYRQDLHKLLYASRTLVERDMRPKYVGAKLTSSTFDAYIRAAEDALCAEFVEPGADDASHFDVLRPYLHSMSYEDFRANHRGRFQYVVKKMRADFVEKARENL